MTRRGLSVAILASLRAAFGRSKEAHVVRRPDSVDAMSAWMDFIAKWNRYAEPLNTGVHDERLWRAAEKAFLNLLA